MKKFLEEFALGFREFGHLVSALVNAVLLSAVYLLGIGPTFIVAKLTGKSFLDVSYRNESYWERLDIGKREKKHYCRQF